MSLFGIFDNRYGLWENYISDSSFLSINMKYRWQQDLDGLNIPYEIIDDKVYLYNEQEPTTEHRIYKLIRSLKNNKYKKYVKKFDHRINRRRTTQRIQREDNDSFDKNVPAYQENSWNWD